MELINILQWFNDLDWSSIISGIIGSGISAFVAFIILYKQVKENRKMMEYQRTCDHIESVKKAGSRLVSTMSVSSIIDRRNRFLDLLNDLQDGKTECLDTRDLFYSFYSIYCDLDLELHNLVMIINDEEECGRYLIDVIEMPISHFKEALSNFSDILDWFDKKKKDEISIERFNSDMDVDVFGVLKQYGKTINNNEDDDFDFLIDYLDISVGLENSGRSDDLNDILGLQLWAQNLINDYCHDLMEKTRYNNKKTTRKVRAKIQKENEEQFARRLSEAK
jgi:hypothetical protein